MAKMPQFTDILDHPVEEAERPKPMPVGQYIWTTVGQPREDVSAKKKTPFVEFTLRCDGPLNDETVDQDALEEWLTMADGSKRRLSDVTQKIVFYKTPDSIYRLRDFLDHLKVDYSGRKSFKQVLGDTPGLSLIGTITHQVSNSGTYANITSTAPLSD